MVLSVPVIALGATLGTATSILALCGVTCLCRHMHPKKGVLKRDRDPDPEKARPGVLRSAQQVSGGGASASRGHGGVSAGSRRRLQRRGNRMGGERSPCFAPPSVAGRRAENVLEDPPRGSGRPGGRGEGRGEELGEGGLVGAREEWGQRALKGRGRDGMGKGTWGRIGTGRRVERLAGNGGGRLGG